MNIVHLNTHDTGRWLGCYGFGVATPRIDALAREGVLFRNARSAAPTCSASRSALLTGLWPHQPGNGMLGLAHVGDWRLGDPSRHLAATLRAAGFDTALAGFQHEAAWAAEAPDGPRSLGYDHLLNHPHLERGHDDATTDEAAVAFLSHPARGDKPFLLSVGYIETHRTTPSQNLFAPPDRLPEHGLPADPDAPRPDADRLTAPGGLPDAPAIRRDWAAFRDGAAVLDARVGRVLDAIDAAGLRDTTLVILTTDHGPAFPEMKGSCREAGLGVALLMRGPGLPAGRIAEPMVSHLDVRPTLAALLGHEPADDWTGTSLLLMVRGEAGEAIDAVHPHLFGAHNDHATTSDPQRSVRDARFHLIHRFDRAGGPPRSAAWHCDGGRSKAFYERAGHEPPAAEFQLYDLWLDPHERRNLAEDPTHGGVKHRLAGELGDWMRHTADPLASGGLPGPADALPGRLTARGVPAAGRRFAGPSVTVPPGARGGSVHLTKNPVEVGRVRKTAPQGHLLHRHGRGAQQLLGPLDPQAQQLLLRALADRPHEAAVQRAPRHAQPVGQAAHAAEAHEVPAHERDRLGHQVVLHGGDVGALPGVHPRRADADAIGHVAVAVEQPVQGFGPPVADGLHRVLHARQRRVGQLAIEVHVVHPQHRQIVGDHPAQLPARPQHRECHRVLGHEQAGVPRQTGHPGPDRRRRQRLALPARLGVGHRDEAAGVARFRERRGEAAVPLQRPVRAHAGADEAAEATLQQVQRGQPADLLVVDLHEGRAGVGLLHRPHAGHATRDRERLLRAQEHAVGAEGLDLRGVALRLEQGDPPLAAPLPGEAPDPHQPLAAQRRQRLVADHNRHPLPLAGLALVRRHAPPYGAAAPPAGPAPTPNATSMRQT